MKTKIFLLLLGVATLPLLWGCEEEGAAPVPVTTAPGPDLKPYEGLFLCVTGTWSFYPDSTEPDTVFVRIEQDSKKTDALNVQDLFSDSTGPVKQRYQVDYLKAGFFKREVKNCSHCDQLTEITYRGLDSIMVSYYSLYIRIGPSILYKGARIR